jgi:hypothetical protein
MTEQGPFRFSLGPTSSGGPPAYSNNVNILTSTWDITFEFSQLSLTASQEENQPPVVSADVVQRIVMSPQHAKAFSEVLRQNVSQWEQQFGEIRLPPPPTQ